MAIIFKFSCPQVSCAWMWWVWTFHRKVSVPPKVRKKFCNSQQQLCNGWSITLKSVFFFYFSSASGCPIASKNKALREQLSGNIKYSNGSSTTFGNRLVALSSSGNSYDPDSQTQEKTSPSHDTSTVEEKVLLHNVLQIWQTLLAITFVQCF